MQQFLMKLIDTQLYLLNSVELLNNLKYYTFRHQTKQYYVS